MMSYINETDFVVENKKLVYPEIVTDGLQLYYDAKGKRDTDYHRDTMLDMSGNKNHGKLHNFAYEKHSGYKDGLVFDYIDDKLVRPTLDLQPDDFTFMLNGNIISFSPDGTVKRVQDGEVIESKGFNLVRNGDFVDGINGWTSTNGVVEMSSGKVLIKGTSNVYYQSLTRYNVFNSSNTVYLRAKVKSLNDGTNCFFQMNDGAGNRIFNARHSLIKNKEYHLSGLYEPRDGRTFDHINVQVYQARGDSGSIEGCEFEISNIMAIDLTQTFGTGNEPTKEQMDEIINRLGFIPNAQDLIDRIEYKGNDLGDMENIIDGLYKTEVLSGEEIYTDKADDAVAHVDIDGKSVGGGSGKNLLQTNFVKGHATGSTTFNDVRAYSSDNFNIEPNKTYTLSVTGNTDFNYGYYVSTKLTYPYNGTFRGWYEIGTSRPLTSSTDGILVVMVSKTGDKEFTLEEIRDIKIQLEVGSTATAYEPPAPTPDYPVEIHSLNDVDVVSSVGRMNLIRGTEDNISWWKSGYPNDASERIKGKITVLRDDTTIGTWNTLFENLENGIESIDSDSDYTLSVDLKISHTPIHTGYIDLQFRDITGKIGKTRQTSIHDLPLNEWTRVSVYVPKTQGYVIKTVYSYITGVYPIGTTIEYKDLKLEKGDRSTPWTPSLGYIAENDNHPLIDKINLLLDEPLRSVGDVKDRLFRDSDGLWKIERNVEEVALADLLWSRGSETSGWKQDGITTAFYTYGLARDGNMNQSIAPIVSHFKTYTDNRLVPRDEVGFTTGGVINYSTIRIPKRTITEDTVPSVKLWMQENGVKIQYVTKIPITETLSQNMQDKLNNLRSFEDSNYVYTVLNKTDILPAVTDNLKPTLHTKFLYNNWYKEDRVINNLMIYNRALTNEEMLQNYKTIKRRWGM